jgi:hypothetical protein
MELTKVESPSFAVIVSKVISIQVREEKEGKGKGKGKTALLLIYPMHLIDDCSCLFRFHKLVCLNLPLNECQRSK